MMTIMGITGGKELLDNGAAGKRPVMTLTIRGEDEHTSVGALAMQLIALIHGANDAELVAKHPEPVVDRYDIGSWDPHKLEESRRQELQEKQRKAQDALNAIALLNAGYGRPPPAAYEAPPVQPPASNANQQQPIDPNAPVPW